MVKVTNNNDQRRYKYKFLKAKPKRRTSDGRFFRVQWLNNDGSDLLVDEKPSYGFVAWNDLDDNLQTKYTKIGTVRKKIQKAKTVVPSAAERAKKNAATIPPKTNNTVAPETRIVGYMPNENMPNGQPIRQVIRPVRQIVPTPVRVNKNLSVLGKRLSKSGYTMAININNGTLKKIEAAARVLCLSKLEGGRWSLGQGVDLCIYKKVETYHQLMNGQK